MTDSLPLLISPISPVFYYLVYLSVENVVLVPWHPVFYLEKEYSANSDSANRKRYQRIRIIGWKFYLALHTSLRNIYMREETTNFVQAIGANTRYPYLQYYIFPLLTPNGFCVLFRKATLTRPG